MPDKLLIVRDERMRLHDAGAGHPERAARLEAIDAELDRAAIEGVEFARAQPAERVAIERVHDSRYVSFIDALPGRSARLDADTVVSPHSVEAAYLAAGAAMQAVDAVMRSEARSAFALPRPPGHHAERDRAMGFCLFNNIAVAAQHAIDAYGVERVLIVDWDVHHGNGTQHIFESRRDVLLVSSHQGRLWPGTGSADEHGSGEGEGFTVNLPLPIGFDDAGFCALFERITLPIAQQYQPQLVLVSAGFDAHRDDPLAQLAMTETGYAQLSGMLRDFARTHCDGRLAMVLEGGYDVGALARSVRACAKVLAGAQPAAARTEPDEPAASCIERLSAAHRRFWRL